MHVCGWLQRLGEGKGTRGVGSALAKGGNGFAAGDREEKPNRESHNARLIVELEDAEGRSGIPR